jgi:NADH-quinone oxidoreductase subunit E
MPYLITQILVVLLFTAALALIVGWLLRGVGFRQQIETLEREREEQRRRANTLEESLAAVKQAAAAAPPPTSVQVRPGLLPSRSEPRAGGEALVALRDRVAQLDGIARSQAERLAELGHRLREKDELIEGLKRQTMSAGTNKQPRAQTTSSPPAGLLSERPAEIDRLQAIAGIGPVLERVLNQLGIYRFGQLARLTPDNIEWLASRIDWFPQRIQREDWVGQARRLHREVHPDEEP